MLLTNKEGHKLSEVVSGQAGYRTTADLLKSSEMGPQYKKEEKINEKN